MDIRRVAIDAMLGHAKRDLPNECCGLLLGTSRLIDYTVAARNLRLSPNRYLVDPVDHFSAIRAARANGLWVVGVYHSHPTGAPIPSATDFREARDVMNWEFVYVIVSPGSGCAETGKIAGYRLRGQSFETVDLTAIV